MHSSNVSTHGMAVAPPPRQSGALAILREGGSAIEAMVAAAVAIAVVYPHMNGLGGDGFWLIVPPEGDPIAIDASGPPDRWRPSRLRRTAAYSPPGTAGRADRRRHRQRLGRGAAYFTGLNRPRAAGGPPVADAIGYAEDGIPVTASQAHATASKLEELRHQPGFSETAGRGRGPAARQPLPPARPRRYPAHAGQRRSRQLLSRAAGRASRAG